MNPKPFLMKRYSFFLAIILPVVFFMLLPAALPAQTAFRVMSYNLENLFDTCSNPDKNDDEFLPEGNRHWTPKRYYHKLRQLAQVITAAGEWDTPALIGLCEVENDTVVQHLLYRTPLKRQAYRYCLTAHSDRRGLQVALLYQRDRFAYLGHASVGIRFSGKTHKSTRDILHVWGKLLTGDTLDVMVCHFPSRYGGEKESERDRFDAALTLRRLTDSLYACRQSPRFILMGDFNDTPTNRSLKEKLGAKPFSGKRSETKNALYPKPDTLRLYNLFDRPRPLSPGGSHKYQGQWSQLDQMLVNEALLDGNSSMQVVPESIRLFAPAFLLIPDKTWRGMRPFRTYYGFKYEGGYSDHLPILADFRLGASPAIAPQTKIPIKSAE